MKLMTKDDFMGFGSWPELCAHISADYKTFYHAPLDYQPVVVSVAVRKDGKVRVSPIYGDADPFTADIKHLSRFRRVINGGSK